MFQNQWAYCRNMLLLRQLLLLPHSQILGVTFPSLTCRTIDIECQTPAFIAPGFCFEQSWSFPSHAVDYNMRHHTTCSQLCETKTRDGNTVQGLEILECNKALITMPLTEQTSSQMHSSHSAWTF